PTTNANDILIFATDTAADQKYWWTPGTGYAIPNNKQTTGGSGSNIRMAMQYAVVSSNQNATTSMNYSNAAWNGNIFAAFKAGSSTGGGPAVTLTPSSVNFGNQNNGTTSAPQTITLSNSGGAELSITSIGITGTNPGDFAQTNNCPPSLAAAASCAINVAFTPAVSGTTRTAT